MEQLKLTDLKSGQFYWHIPSDGSAPEIIQVVFGDGYRCGSDAAINLASLLQTGMIVGPVVFAAPDSLI